MKLKLEFKMKNRIGMSAYNTDTGAFGTIKGFYINDKPDGSYEVFMLLVDDEQHVRYVHESKLVILKG